MIDIYSSPDGYGTSSTDMHEIGKRCITHVSYYTLYVISIHNTLLLISSNYIINVQTWIRKQDS